MGEGISTISTGQRTERKSTRIESRQQEAPREKKTVDTKSFNRAMGRVGYYTDINYHNEAYRGVSKYFKYDDLTDRYNKVIKQYNKDDYMTQKNINTKNKIDDELFARIKEDYGDDILRQVQRKL